MMKKPKKILALLLTLCMIISVCTVVFAEDESNALTVETGSASTSENTDIEDATSSSSVLNSESVNTEDTASSSSTLNSENEGTVNTTSSSSASNSENVGTEDASSSSSVPNGENVDVGDADESETSETKWVLPASTPTDETVVVMTEPLMLKVAAPAPQEDGETQDVFMDYLENDRVTWTDDWQDYESEVLFSNTVGGVLTVSFNGTGIVIYGQKAPNGPIAEIAIDGGTPEDCDFYAAAKTESNVKVYEKTGMEPGEHTLTLAFTERENANLDDVSYAHKQIAVSGFGVFPNPAQHTVTVECGTGDGLYASGDTVVVKADAPEFGVTFEGWNAEGMVLADATQPQFTFTMPENDVKLTATYKKYFERIGYDDSRVERVDADINTDRPGWDEWTQSEPAQIFCNRVGNYVVVNFEGVGISVNGFIVQNGPIAEIIIDEGTENEIRGEADFFDASSRNICVSVYTRLGLANGSHTLKVVYTDKTNPAMNSSWVNNTQMAIGGFDIYTEDYVAPKYPVTVINGSGSGQYEMGEVVEIEADDAPEGKVFSHWVSEDGGSFASVTSSKTTFSVPAYGATVRAEYAQTYEVTVTGGSGSGWYKAGETVSIEADEAPEGKTFVKWVSEDNVQFVSETLPKTTFTVPEGGASISIEYRDVRVESLDFYVDSENGNDDADGHSPKTAWKTLAKVNETELRPGDRVLLRANCVFEGALLVDNASGTAAKPIVIDMYEGNTIGAEAGERPHIKGDGKTETAISGAVIDKPGMLPVSYGIYVRNSSHVTVRNIEVSNLSASRKYSVGVCVEAYNCGVVSDVHLDNLYVHDVNGTLLEKTVPNGGIYFTASGHEFNTHFDNISVENCIVKEVSRTGISVGYTSSWKQWDGHNGRIPQELLDAYGHTNVVIRNNYVENSGGDAIVPMFSIAPLIEYNISNGASLNTKDNKYAMYNAAIWPWRCEDAVFQFNEAYNTYENGDGQAYDCDFSRGTIYQYNYSHDNGGGFILVCQGESIDSVIRYNISQNDKDSLFLVSNSNDAQVYNNTFYIGEGLNTQIVDDANGKLTLTNNIFYNEGTRTSPNWGGATRFQYDHNLFYGYVTTPQQDENAIIADPLFIDPGKGENGTPDNSAIDTLEGYTLRTGSPAIDAGVTIPDNGGRDFLGNPLSDGKIDLGAIDVPSARDTAQQIYDQYSGYKAEIYEAEGWKIFEKALQELKVLLDAQDSSNTALNAAAEKLKKAASTLHRVYPILIEGGSASKTSAKEGDAVTVTAQAPAGKRFVRWTSEEVVFANSEAVETTFVMPAKAVSIHAVYEIIDDGTSDTSTSTSSESSSTSESTPSGPSSTSESTPSGLSSGVQTGDSVPVFLLLALALCCLAGLVVILSVRKNRTEKQ